MSQQFTNRDTKGWGLFDESSHSKHAVAAYSIYKTRSVSPASSRVELMAVAALMLLIGSAMGLRFFLLASQELGISLRPYQRLDTALSPNQHHIYRTLLSSVGDIEDQRIEEGQWPEAVLLEEEGITPFASELMPTPSDRLQWVSYDGGTWVDYLGTAVDGDNQISYILRLIDLHGTYHPHPHPGIDYDPALSVGVQVWTFDESGRLYPGERLPEAGWIWVVSRADPMFARSSSGDGTIAAPRG